MKVSKKINVWALAAITLVFMYSFTACNNPNDKALSDNDMINKPVTKPAVENLDSVKTKLTDAEIASVAVVANQIDIKYGKIALVKSKNAEVRKFAETMIKDHEGIIKTAVDLTTKLGVTPDDDNDVTRSLIEGEKVTSNMLNSHSGDRFDKAYIDNEVVYHEAVIIVVKDVLIPQSENGGLKSTLQSILPVLEHHLEMAKTAQTNLNK